jgi:hypothetical protein
MAARRNLPVRWKPDLHKVSRGLPTKGLSTTKPEEHEYLFNNLLDKRTQSILKSYGLDKEPDDIPRPKASNKAEAKRESDELEYAIRQMRSIGVHINRQEGLNNVRHYGNNFLMGKLLYVQAIKDNLE